MMSRLLSLLLSGLFCVTIHGDDCPYQECYCAGNSILCNYRSMTSIPHLVQKGNPVLSILRFEGNSITFIPAGSLPANLTQITLDQNPIETIEDGAFDESLYTLKTVQLSDARFTQIPPAVLSLKNVTDFSLSDTIIHVWDADAMTRFGATMETFSLVAVGLTSWPDWIRSFSHLTQLTITGSDISSLPDDALELVSNSLLFLYLHNNNLNSVPKAVSKLNVLTTLMLAQNNITDTTWLPQLSNVTTLLLGNNEIRDANQLGTALRAYAGSLNTFQISHNSLTSIPELSFLKLIRSLDYTNNHISDPNSGSLPDGLRELDLGNNYLPFIPRVMRNMSQMHELELNSNRVTSIQGSDFTSAVTQVDMNDNYITELTQTSFPSNSGITALYLNNNPISAISIDAFNNIPFLSQLEIQHSKLTRLPLSIASLKSLVVINLRSSADLVCTCMEKNLEAKIKSMLSYNVVGDCGHTSIYTFFTDLSQDCPPITRALQWQP